MVQKTTVFNVVTGVYRPTEGQVIFNPNKDERISIDGLSPDEIKAWCL